MFVAHLLTLHQMCSRQEAGSPARMAGGITAGTRPELVIAPQCNRIQEAGPPARTAGGTAMGTRPALVTSAQRERLKDAAASDPQQPLSPPQPRYLAMPVEPSVQRRRCPPPPPPTVRGPPCVHRRCLLRGAHFRPSYAAPFCCSIYAGLQYSAGPMTVIVQLLGPEACLCWGRGSSIVAPMHQSPTLSPSLWCWWVFLLGNARFRPAASSPRGSDNPGCGSVVPGHIIYRVHAPDGMAR